MSRINNLFTVSIGLCPFCRKWPSVDIHSVTVNMKRNIQGYYAGINHNCHPGCEINFSARSTVSIDKAIKNLERKWNKRGEV